jgi:predicted nucleotidyltransferase
MATTVAASPTIVRFRKALNEMYADRIDRVVLFGSRAHGDSRPGSDYDVAVFLHDMDDPSVEMERLADLTTYLVLETGEFVHAVPCRAGAYTELAPLMLGIRTDGIDL